MSICLAVLVSGRGSNMKAILEARAQGRLDASISVVLSNNPDAPALEIARQYGVPAVAVSHKGLTREQHEKKVLEELGKYKIDFVVLAGYMRILTSQFLNAFRHPSGYFRVINIHPSILPAFPGASGYEDAFAYGVRISGVTVHLVDEQVDHGPILAQACFVREDDDTLESFRARGLELEHRLYPSVLQSIALQGINLLPQALKPAVITAGDTSH